MDGRTKILEIESNAETSVTILENFKKKIKQHYES
jgi:hypothetical protein